jgi:hypothetical protein
MTKKQWKRGSIVAVISMLITVIFVLLDGTFSTSTQIPYTGIVQKKLISEHCSKHNCISSQRFEVRFDNVNGTTNSVVKDFEVDDTAFAKTKQGDTVRYMFTPDEMYKSFGRGVVQLITIILILVWLVIAFMGMVILLVVGATSIGEWISED